MARKKKYRGKGNSGVKKNNQTILKEKNNKTEELPDIIKWFEKKENLDQHENNYLEYLKKHREWAKKFNVNFVDRNHKQNSNCLHDNCPECGGTGKKKNGLGMCIHFISCPCEKCTPRYSVNKDINLYTYQPDKTTSFGTVIPVRNTSAINIDSDQKISFYNKKE